MGKEGLSEENIPRVIDWKPKMFPPKIICSGIYAIAVIEAIQGKVLASLYF